MDSASTARFSVVLALVSASGKLLPTERVGAIPGGWDGSFAAPGFCEGCALASSVRGTGAAGAATGGSGTVEGAEASGVAVGEGVAASLSWATWLVVVLGRSAMYVP